MDILKLYEKTKNLGISPNDYVYLSLIQSGSKEIPIFNEHLSRKILIKNGYLSKDGKITQEGKALFGEVADITEEFRELFPKGILPNGRAAKSTYQEIDKKLKWFFSNYDYSSEDVINATKQYIEYYSKRDFNYMQTASNFISKTDTNHIKSSSLAEWCEKIKSGEDINEQFDINV